MEGASHFKASTEPAAWQVLRPRGRWDRIDFRELWSYRELAFMLALRDLQLRYRQTIFGIGWALLQPAAGGVLFWLIFGEAVDVPSDGLPYLVFVLAGLAVWSYLASAVGSAANSLVEHRQLVEKVWFPRLIAPVAATLALIPDLLIGMVFVVPFMIGYGIEPSVQVLLLPVWLAASVLVALGAGLWLSAANVLYRDVRYALTFLLQMWLFVSPVVYPSSVLDEGWRYVLALNPVAGVIDGIRWSLLDGPAPGPELIVSASALLVLLTGGILYFHRSEQVFADRI